MSEFGSAGDGGQVGGNAPTSQPTSGGQSDTSNPPSYVDVSDDTQIRIKGQDKPVRFGDYGRNFQSQFTKASQEAARLRKEIETRDARIRQFETEQQAARQSRNGGQQQDVYENLRKLPYLTGSDAVGMVETIGQQLQQRDAIQLAVLKQLKQQRELLNMLNQNHTNNAFEGKIGKWLTDGGYPPEAADLAKEIYLAYEGDDLDSDFPRIFSERWNQIEKIMEARRQQRINAARKQPFIPGKGGNATPSKPLELKANASPKEIADQLFGSWNGSET